MAEHTVIPFGPQHPVLPEPLHFDLELEDEKVVKAIPRLGFVHRGLERLVEKKDYNQYVFITERICGICSFGHSLGYSQCVEALMGVEVPPRAEALRVVWHELSRIHSHLLWLGLAADSFGYENLFMQCFRIRENILDIFENTTGGRVVLSACNVGGVLCDIPDEDLAGIVQIVESVCEETRTIVGAFLKDTSVKSRLADVGYISKEDAKRYSLVGPFGRASGLPIDVRNLGYGGYGLLSDFEPITSDGCDCLARVEVRIKEIFQSADIIKEIVSKMPEGAIYNKPKGNPPEGSECSMVLEQPRGECYYYASGNGTKFLERFRIRTPTSMNVCGMTMAMTGCQLADVPMIILSIDPCISCTER